MFVFFFVKYFPRFRSFTEKITRTFQTIKLICFYKIRTSVYRHCFITIWNLNRFLLPLAIQSTSQKKKNSILDQPQQTKKKILHCFQLYGAIIWNVISFTTNHKMIYHKRTEKNKKTNKLNKISFKYYTGCYHRQWTTLCGRQSCYAPPSTSPNRPTSTLARFGQTSIPGKETEKFTKNSWKLLYFLAHTPKQTSNPFYTFGTYVFFHSLF